MSCRPTRPPLLAILPFFAFPWFLLAILPLIIPLLGWLLARLFNRCFFNGALVRLLPNRLFIDCLCLELDLFKFCCLPLFPFALSLLKLLLLSFTLVGASCKFPRELERLRLLCELDLDRLVREFARDRELARLWLRPRELARIGTFPRCWRCKARRGRACCCWGWLRTPRRLAKLFDEFERLKAGAPLSFRLEIFKYTKIIWYNHNYVLIQLTWLR